MTVPVRLLVGQRVVDRAWAVVEHDPWARRRGKEKETGQAQGMDHVQCRCTRCPWFDEKEMLCGKRARMSLVWPIPLVLQTRRTKFERTEACPRSQVKWSV